MVGVKTKDKNESLVYNADKILWEEDKAVGKKTLYLNSPSGALVGYKYDTDRRNVITDLIGSVRRIYDFSDGLNNYLNFDAFGNTLEQGSSPEEDILWNGSYLLQDGEAYKLARWYSPEFAISNQGNCPHERKPSEVEPDFIILVADLKNHRRLAILPVPFTKVWFSPSLEGGSYLQSRPGSGLPECQWIHSGARMRPLL